MLGLVCLGHRVSEVFSRHPHLPRAGSGVKGGPTVLSDRSSQTLDAADGSPHSTANEASRLLRGLPRCRIPLRLSTKARLLESYGERCYHQPCIRSLTTDHDSYSKLPFLLQGEAGRSIKKTMDSRPSSGCSGYPACEPAAPA